MTNPPDIARHRSLLHRLYAPIRPRLKNLGVLDFARSVLGRDQADRLAALLGLRDFRPGPEDWAGKRKRTARSETVRPQADGINFLGDLRAPTGIGESSRAIVRAMRGAAFKINYIECPLDVRNRNEPLPDGIEIASTPYSFTLIHLNALEFGMALDLLPDSVFRKTYVIGFWYWELPEFPRTQRRAFDYVDEVWVASRFVREAVGTDAPVPVTRIPLPVEPVVSGARRGDFGLPEDRFIFVFSFSRLSGIGRKNPFGFIEAFRRAFGRPSSGPLLVLKVHHLDADNASEFGSALARAVESVGGIPLTKHLTRIEHNDLLNLSDCFVSLHRSEGFGLGMAEAMALGKPVVATAFSGNMDFMTERNGFPVRYALREITAEDHRFQPEFMEVYEPNQRWAEPDLDHAAELMRFVHENPETARRIGEQARADIASGHGFQAAGKHVADRIGEIVRTRRTE